MFLKGEPRRIDGIAHGDGFYALGVGREAPEALFAFGAGPRERVRYVERDIDKDLRLQLRDEPARDRLSVVIVTGPSGAGKSRTLSEALADVLPDASLVVPKDAANLVWLGQSGGPTGRSPRWVVWLDDLERFVRAGQEGLNKETLSTFQTWSRPPLIVATAGGRGLVASREATLRSDLQAELLSLPEVKVLLLGDALSQEERSRLESVPGIEGDAPAQIATNGFGQFMSGGAVARLLLDVPAPNPRLGFGPIARALSNTVMQSEPRFAIGIRRLGVWQDDPDAGDRGEAALRRGDLCPVRRLAL